GQVERAVVRTHLFLVLVQQRGERLLHDPDGCLDGFGGSRTFVREFVSRVNDRVALAARRTIHGRFLNRTEQKKMLLNVVQLVTVLLKSPFGGQFVNRGDVFFDGAPVVVEQFLRYFSPVLLSSRENDLTTLALGLIHVPHQLYDGFDRRVTYIERAVLALPDVGRF